jgi:hypothetical protein
MTIDDDTLKRLLRIDDELMKSVQPVLHSIQNLLKQPRTTTLGHD